jgi:hypothetical protein
MIWTVLWLTWGGVFVVIEGAALITRTPDATLSEHIWAWLLIRDRRHRALSWVLRGLTLAFMVWLTGHLVFGWWPR